MTKNKEILVILSPGFPASENDTTCLPMQQSFIRSLIRNFSHLHILVLSFQYPYFEKKYKWFEATVYSFNGRNKGGISRLFLRRELNTALKKLSAENKITGLLSFWYGECALVGRRFSARHGIRHYCWIMGQDAKKENKYPALIPPKQDDLIALSDFLQDEFAKNHGVRPRHMVPAAVDPLQFPAPAAEKDIDIMGAGSLIPLKRYDIFLDIIGEIKKQMPSVKVVLTGNGPEKENLIQLITQLNLHPNITLTGELSHPGVLQLMQRTKLFLHPSAYEGFSGVCLEALHCGAHVISFCRAMNRDIEQWQTVLTKKEMKDKALEILQDPRAEYKRVTVFKMDDTVKKIMDLFNYSEDHGS